MAKTCAQKASTDNLFKANMGSALSSITPGCHAAGKTNLTTVSSK